jgi:hypothetical protein
MERKSQQSARQLSAYRVYELLFGESARPPHDVGPNSYDGYVTDTGPNINLANYIGEEMFRDWQMHRLRLMQFWNSGEFTTAEIFPGMPPWLFNRGYPEGLPWAARVFDGMSESSAPEVSTSMRP